MRKLHKEDEEKTHNDSSLLQDSLLFEEGNLSTPGHISDSPLEEAAVKAGKIEGKSKVDKAVSKKPKESKGKVKSSLRVDGSEMQGFGDDDQTGGKIIKSVPESSTLQEDSFISEAKSEVSNSLEVLQKSLKMPAKIPSTKQPVKKVVPKNAKLREKLDKQRKKVLAKPPSKVVGENLFKSSQLHPPCSGSQFCHCAR